MIFFLPVNVPGFENGREYNVSLTISRFDLQHLVPTQCIVPLNTITKGSPLFIVHPIEGATIALATLAVKLACPVFGIQCTTQAPLSSLEALAAFYVQV